MRSIHLVIASTFGATALFLSACNSVALKEQQDLSYGMYLPPHYKIEPKDQEFYDGFYTDGVSEWATGTDLTKEPLVADLKALSSLKSPPCGLPCLEFAVKIQKAGRRQISGVINEGDAQRQSAKAQLETIFLTTHAKDLPEWVRQTIRVNLRDVFLPPRLATVRAAMYEIQRRETGKRTPAYAKEKPEVLVNELELLMSRLEGEQLGGERKLNDKAAFLALDRISIRLDWLETSYADKKHESLWLNAGDIQRRLRALRVEAEIGWDILDHASAAIYARIDNNDSLREIASYAPLYGIKMVLPPRQ